MEEKEDKNGKMRVRIGGRQKKGRMEGREKEKIAPKDHTEYASVNVNCVELILAGIQI